MILDSVLNWIRFRFRNWSNGKRPYDSSADDDECDDDDLIVHRGPSWSNKRLKIQLEPEAGRQRMSNQKSAPEGKEDGQESADGNRLTGMATWLRPNIRSFQDTYYTKKPEPQQPQPQPQPQQTVRSRHGKGVKAPLKFDSPSWSLQPSARVSRNSQNIARNPPSSVHDKIVGRTPSGQTHNKWNVTTIYDSVRLIERDRYKSMIQQYTNLPLSSPMATAAAAATTTAYSATNGCDRQPRVRLQKLDLSYGSDLRGRLQPKKPPSPTRTARGNWFSLNATPSNSVWMKHSSPNTEIITLSDDDENGSVSGSVSRNSAANLMRPPNRSFRSHPMVTRKTPPAAPMSVSLSLSSSSSSSSKRTVTIDDKDDEVIQISSEEDAVEVLTVEQLSKPKSWSVDLNQVNVCKNPIIGGHWLNDLQCQYDRREDIQKKSIAAYEDEVQKLIKDKCSDLERRIEETLHVDDVRIVDYDIEPNDAEEDSEENLALPVLSEGMLERIDQALVPNPPNEVLTEAFGLTIRRRDMDTLAAVNWLNDEVINFYFTMLMERSKLDNFPSLYSCNTFFYPKLIGGGHAVLKRWTRKVDIFAHEMMLVPVHLGVHWCLAVVDFSHKKISYYDSMGSKNDACLKALMEYLKAEHLDKKGSAFDDTDWKTENEKDNPHQLNGSDCGMFACKYAEYLSRRAKITFTQADMPYFRKRMVYELLTKQLL